MIALGSAGFESDTVLCSLDEKCLDMLASLFKSFKIQNV